MSKRAPHSLTQIFLLRKKTFLISEIKLLINNCINLYQIISFRYVFELIDTTLIQKKVCKYVKIVVNLLLHLRHTTITPLGGRKGTFFQSHAWYVDATFVAFASRLYSISICCNKSKHMYFHCPATEGHLLLPLFKKSPLSFSVFAQVTVWVDIVLGRGVVSKDVPFHTCWQSMRPRLGR